MKLLLDTHSLIWFFSGHPSLSDVARQFMEDASNQKFPNVSRFSAV
jgi:PIN domain nuclease of toxin-antitoxin system